MKVKNVTIEIVLGDITELGVDALVNHANSSLLMFTGLAGVIKQKGGATIEDEAGRQAPLAPGLAVATKAGNLKARHVIHAVTVADNVVDEKTLRSAVFHALRAAEHLGVESLALPALGCGKGGFPAVGAAKIIAQEVLKFARFDARTVKRITLCLLDPQLYEIFSQQVSGYINHVQDHLGLGPYLTVDIIIAMPDGIVVIERSNPPYGLALPGGFVDYGESVEDAARREAKEETNLDLLDLRQLGVFSNPERDPRFHTVSVVFTSRGQGTAQSGDDAKALQIIPASELLNYDYAFDHKKILRDYLSQKR